MAELYTFKHAGGPPTLRDAAAALGVAEHTLDPAFGVIAINTEKQLYTVRTIDGKDSSGANVPPFSDPRIEPFGPPQ